MLELELEITSIRNQYIRLAIRHLFPIPIGGFCNDPHLQAHPHVALQLETIISIYEYVLALNPASTLHCCPGTNLLCNCVAMAASARLIGCSVSHLTDTDIADRLVVLQIAAAIAIAVCT